MERSSISLSYYPCLSELLTLPVFRGSRLLGCQTGLERVVTGVNLSDTPEYYKWLCAGELMVTTCYSIHDDPAALAQFIPTLAAGGMSGLCVKPGQYLGQVPQTMVNQAEMLGLPLVALPEDVRFSDITKAVSDELLRRQTALLHSTITVNEMLTRTIVEGAGLEEIARMVTDLTGCSVLILDCINDRRALSLTEADAVRFAGLTPNPAPLLPERGCMCWRWADTPSDFCTYTTWSIPSRSKMRISSPVCSRPSRWRSPGSVLCGRAAISCSTTSSSTFSRTVLPTKPAS